MFFRTQYTHCRSVPSIRYHYKPARKRLTTLHTAPTFRRPQAPLGTTEFAAPGRGNGFGFVGVGEGDVDVLATAVVAAAPPLLRLPLPLLPPLLPPPLPPSSQST